MRYVWIDAGNDARGDLRQLYGIDGCFFDVREDRLNAAYLEGVKAKGYAVGVYVHVDGWEETKNLSARAAAEWMAAAVEHVVGSKRTASFPKVQFDIERHDPGFVLACLGRWRELMPKQDTSWTMEGGQGGWMGPVVKPPAKPSSFVQGIKALGIRLVPQLYNGDMTEVWDSLAYARDLTRRGFENARVSPFYDAAHLPVGWAGFAFTQGRLPQ